MRLIHTPLGTTSALVAAMALTIGCGSKSTSSYQEPSSSAKVTTADLPEVPREFRAVWVATVANIDWPTQPGLSVEQQKAEAIDILDRCVELNMNAVVFQVRPHADALYESPYEPWSYYLTGEQGKAPVPFYDPLQFWIDESHKRGLELHAWFNPYRALHPIQKGPIAEDSIVKTRPDLAKPLKPSEAPECFYWMDPGEPEVQEISRTVMLDVATRYNVDGIHIDDYFYPYPSYLEEGMDFPDDESWAKYQAAGGDLSRDDWRRKNVDDFVRDFYNALRDSESEAEFGISPFGIWRPGYPETIQGLDQYDVLYADAKLWLNEGWVDYWTPQLYWPIDQEPQSYTTLLRWWVEENEEGRHVYPGNGFHNVASGKTHWDVQEAVDQIIATRQQEGANGNVIFSMKQLMPGSGPEKMGLSTALKEGPWAEKALVPTTPWIDDVPPATPGIQVSPQGMSSIAPDDDAFNYVIYTKNASGWDWEIVPAADVAGVEMSVTTETAVRAVDQNGNLSKGAAFFSPSM